MDWTKSDDGYAVTKAWAGFELIQTLLAEDNKTIYLYEKWVSEEHQGYLSCAWKEDLWIFLDHV